MSPRGYTFLKTRGCRNLSAPKDPKRDNKAAPHLLARTGVYACREARLVISVRFHSFPNSHSGTHALLKFHFLFPPHPVSRMPQDSCVKSTLSTVNQHQQPLDTTCCPAFLRGCIPLATPFFDPAKNNHACCLTRAIFICYTTPPYVRNPFLCAGSIAQTTP